MTYVAFCISVSWSFTMYGGLLKAMASSWPLQNDHDEKEAEKLIPLILWKMLILFPSYGLYIFLH